MADLFNQKLDGTAWKTKPSWYIVAAEIRPSIPTWNALPPSAWAPPPSRQSSHVPMLSNPAVLDVIRAANAAQNSQAAA